MQVKKERYLSLQQEPEKHMLLHSLCVSLDLRECYSWFIEVSLQDRQRDPMRRCLQKQFQWDLQVLDIMTMMQIMYLLPCRR